MSEPRIEVSRTVSLPDYQNVHIGVSLQVAEVRGSDLRTLLGRIDRWIDLYRRSRQLRQELESAENELRWARKELERHPDDDGDGVREATVQIEEIQRRINETESEWEA